MNQEEGRVPYGAALIDQKRRQQGVPVKPKEPPRNAEYRRDLRRQRQIIKMLRDRRYREDE